MEEEGEDGRIAATVVIVLVTVLVVLVLFLGMRVVKQTEVVIIERCGRYSRTLTPGFHWLIPLVDLPRSINWRHVEAMQNGTTTTVKKTTRTSIDLREHVLDMAKSPVITKDTVEIEIDALCYFRISDPLNAVYRVNNLPDAIEFLAASTLRNVLAHMTLDETFSSRESISAELLSIMQRDTERWGVRITRVELVDIDPPRDIINLMEYQIKAERERRSLVLSADGRRESSVIRSRGTAAQILNRAEGTRASTILRAKGEAAAKRLEAKAQARSLAEIRNAVKASGVRAVDYLTVISYLTSLSRLSRRGNATAVLLPAPAMDIASVILPTTATPTPA